MIDEEVNKHFFSFAWGFLVYYMTEQITSLWLAESKRYLKDPFTR